jgi:KDO2-lipid IV(A) lauroyltransferase
LRDWKSDGVILYRILYAFLYLVSLLPMWVLYLVSDFAYFLLYHILGYRKKVVFDNLRLAFPQKTEHERLHIAKKFYHNFTDNFIEFIKLISASPRYISKRFTGDYAIFEELRRQGRKCELLLAHNFNWEWACLAVGLEVKQPLLVVYMPIASKPIDRLFKKIRSKTGGILLPATDMRNAIMPYRNDPYVLGLVSDQSPGDPQNAYWFPLFNQPTAFIKGPESGARRGNPVVLFCRFYKKRRGYYHIVFEMGEDQPAATAEGDVTRKYVNYLENFIVETPELWLWSHRRWKWQWKPGFGKVFERTN